MKLKLEQTDDELIESFFALTTPEQIAELLEITYKVLNYYLYILPVNVQYRTFNISKKSKGERKICAPITPIKIIQKKLNYILQKVYKVKTESGKEIICTAEERFNVGGFFIHISNNSDITLPTRDISTRANEDFGGYKFQSSLIFNATNNNTFIPGEEIEISFDKDLDDFGRIYYVQVIPTRWQHQENILRYVSCGTVSTHKEEINC